MDELDDWPGILVVEIHSAPGGLSIRRYRDRWGSPSVTEDAAVDRVVAAIDVASTLLGHSLAEVGPAIVRWFHQPDASTSATVSTRPSPGPL